MSIFWELYQQQQIFAAKMEAADARFTARNARLRISKLEELCYKSLLVSAALWSLLRDKCGLSEDELLERVNQIDVTDGKLDGRVRHPPAECLKCKRITPRRLYECIYCGEKLPGNPFAG